MRRQDKKFLIENQRVANLMKNFARKNLAVMKKAVLLQPQIARFSVAKTDKFCDMMQASLAQLVRASDC